ITFRKYPLYRETQRTGHRQWNGLLLDASPTGGRLGIGPFLRGNSGNDQLIPPREKQITPLIRRRMTPGSIVYLIPSSLHEASAVTIPAYVLDAVKQCQVFFVENERSARRFLKSLWKEMVIDQYTWVVIDPKNVSAFKAFLREGKNIGIISEA